MAGKPTEYKSEYCIQVEKLCKILCPDLAGVAYFFSVGENEIIEWSTIHEEFKIAALRGYDGHGFYLQAQRDKQEKRNKRKRKLLAESPLQRVINNVRSQVHYHLKNKNGRHSFDLLGYSCEELMKHLEAQFKPGMTWHNYGRYWHIDHKTPVSWFSYETSECEEFKKCWALSNLQPLEATLNLKKNNKYASA